MTSINKESIEREAGSFFGDRPPGVALKALDDRILELSQCIATLKNKKNWASGSSNPDPIALDHASERRDTLENARYRLLMSVGGGRRR
jgi:hypothetical protein